MKMNEAQLRALINATNGIYEIIQLSGGIPSGHLYARLMGQCSLDVYNFLLNTLIESGRVKQFNFFLTAVPPNVCNVANPPFPETPPDATAQHRIQRIINKRKRK